VVSETIKKALETVNIVIVAKPISVAQTYLSQLITSFPYMSLQLVNSFIIKPSMQCRPLAYRVISLRCGI
jgi:hypothetical protein